MGLRSDDRRLIFGRHLETGPWRGTASHGGCLDGRTDKLDILKKPRPWVGPKEGLRWPTPQNGAVGTQHGGCGPSTLRALPPSPSQDGS